MSPAFSVEGLSEAWRPPLPWASAVDGSMPGIAAFRLAEPHQFLKIPRRILGDLVHNLGKHACGGYAGVTQHPGNGI
jgi:hypothetical protein